MVVYRLMLKFIYLLFCLNLNGTKVVFVVIINFLFVVWEEIVKVRVSVVSEIFNIDFIVFFFFYLWDDFLCDIYIYEKIVLVL